MKKTKQLNHLVLAEGEATGHKHQVVGQGACLYESDTAGVLLLDVPYGAEVQHEEHRAQPIQFHGLNERLIVREYDHFAEEARQVAD